MVHAFRRLLTNTAQSPGNCIRLALFALLGAQACYFGFLHFSAQDSVNLMKHWGYVFMMLGLGWFCVELFLAVRGNRGELWPWLKHHCRWPFWTLLVVLTLYLWFSQKVGFKVIMDEINLLGTSLYLHMDNKSMSLIRGYELNGSFLPLGGFVDKRPLFYPFLVSLLHDATGYRPANAFYLNLALIPLTLAVSYLIGVILSGKRGGLLAMVLVACFPMFNQCCHGGGFEGLNYFMILLTMLAGILFLRRPEPQFLSLLCLSFVLLANVRYESVLFIIPVALFILVGWLKAERIIFCRGLWLTPILLMPIPLLHRVFELDAKDSWQLWSKGAEEPFALEFVPRNFGQAVSMFFGLGHEQPVTIFLSVFGFLGCALFLIVLLRESRKRGPMRPEILGLAFMSIGVFALMGLLLLYFWDFDDTVTRRLALPILLVLIFPGVASLGALFQTKAHWPWFLGAAVLAILFEVSPRNAKDIYTTEYAPGVITNWKSEFALDQREQGKYNLMIDVPGLWVTHLTPAITNSTAINKKDLLKFHLDNKTFDNIYLIQMFTKDLLNYQLRSGKFAALDDDFVLETVEEKTFSGVLFLRLSRVVDIKNTDTEWIKDKFEVVAVDDPENPEQESATMDYQQEQKRRLASLLP